MRHMHAVSYFNNCFQMCWAIFPAACQESRVLIFNTGSLVVLLKKSPDFLSKGSGLEYILDPNKKKEPCLILRKGYLEDLDSQKPG